MCGLHVLQLVIRPSCFYAPLHENKTTNPMKIRPQNDHKNTLSRPDNENLTQQICSADSSVVCWCRCLQQLGSNHGSLVSTLVPELLSTHPFFMGKEPDIDDPACILHYTTRYCTELVYDMHCVSRHQCFTPGFLMLCDAM